MSDPTSTSTGTRTLLGRRWVLAACLAALGAVLAIAAILSNDPATPTTSAEPGATASSPLSTSTPVRTKAPAASRTPAPRITAPETTTAAPLATPEGTLPTDPVAISIPSVAVSSELVRLGLEEDRTVEVPENAEQAGWYELGTSPGQLGSAVILGHVDSAEGPAVFYRLRELVPGSRVLVTLGDGTVETFEVSRLETIPNDEFPAERVYAGTPDRPTLNIVTCGGDYDSSRGGYQSNVIAYTEHVSTDPPA
ncbi:class F sortase [Nocardioides sp.]|uniref:class F sortase n=1 Tax=Nocardioides sp. TaxID=35761 RepID=UPI002B7D1F41|nr:class F sortase [Nocardioides sp.]HXH79461.1 class F sortase [Nocardioides sp.]